VPLKLIQARPILHKPARERVAERVEVHTLVLQFRFADILFEGLVT
jgi:hypothetical protein